MFGESGAVHHPVFARLYSLLSGPGERAGLAALREEALADLSGRVIEVGAGQGLNFDHYPGTVTEVVAVEPEPYLRGKAMRAAGGASLRITVVDGLAEALPADDAGFDAAVASLVLCSVPDQTRALRELVRVVRPGGELRFLEHVIAGPGRLARVQRWADRGLWPAVSGGCHCARDTAGAIEAAGFEMVRLRRFSFRPCPLAGLTSPCIVGSARRPDTAADVRLRSGNRMTPLT